MRITCVDAHLEDGTIRHFTMEELFLYLREQAQVERQKVVDRIEELKGDV